MATTANGFIGLPDGNSDWVSEADEESFLDHIKSHRVVLMGRETYEVNKEYFPFPDALNVVLTRNKELQKENEKELFTDQQPSDLLKYLKSKGFNNALLIGGRETNTAFLEEKLIDEVKLIVHPLIFCDGMEIFHESKSRIKLELLETRNLSEGLVQLHYKVVNRH